MRAYCYASGLIEFGRRCPDGALPIARGPAKPLQDFISAKARHGYKTEKRGNRRVRIEGTDCLLVPGVPEAEHDMARLDAVIAFQLAINDGAPTGVIVLGAARAREALS
jgi:hypothetical protein